MLTLQEYEKIALKLISIYRKKVKWIPVEDQLIGNIIRYMSIGDWRYDPNKSKGKTRKQIRRMYGIYGIRDYVKEKKGISFDEYHFCPEVAYNIKAGKKVNFIIRNAGFSLLQTNVINGYLEGKSISMIADQLGISCDRCRKIYRIAIKKMRKFARKQQ